MLSLRPALLGNGGKGVAQREPLPELCASPEFLAPVSLLELASSDPELQISNLALRGGLGLAAPWLPHLVRVGNGLGPPVLAPNF